MSSSELVRLVAAGERGLGRPDPAAQWAIESMSKERYRQRRWRSIRYEIFERLWRRG